MAATERGKLSAALQALTASALLLPGVQPALGQQGSGDSANVQFSTFSEGRRHTSVDTRADPLHAYTIEFNATKTLDDGDAVHLALLQDSWSGATPVTVAPAAFGGNRPVLANAGTGTVVAGASPIVNGSLLLDRQLKPLLHEGNELVLSSASPEVRREADVAWDFNETARHHTLAAGYSNEPDFHSWHGDWHSRFDFNRQQTTLALGAGYVHSAVDATLDAALLPYLSLDANSASYHRNGNVATLNGTRTERSLDLGLTQVLDHDSIIDLAFRIADSNGLLEHPYKTMTVLFVPPDALASGANTITADVRALPEQRPDARRQQSASARYVHHFDASDAALHVDYGYSHDDWGITSHSIELQWLQPFGHSLLSPRVRWYSQSAAFFHAPTLTTVQRFRAIARDEQGRELWHDTALPGLHYLRTADGTLLDPNGRVLDPALVSAAPDFVNFSRQLLPQYFSSDSRLGGYGVISAGLGVQHRFGSGLRLDAGIDYYRRASSLQFGGSGDSAYADYHYVSASLALVYDWQAPTPSHAHHHAADDSADVEPLAPAAVHYVHAAMPAGSAMAGYQLTLNNPGMAMHMLDLHYAVTAHWSLMLMPMFMTMPHQHDDSVPALHAHHSDSHENGSPHAVIAASAWQGASAGGQWQATAGIGVPVTASDTWSAQPALAWWRQQDRWQWGLQVRGRTNLQPRQANDTEPSQLGELNLWASSALTTTLKATLHAVHSHSRYNQWGTYRADALGIGFSVPVLGQPLQLEWLQVVSGNPSPFPHQQGGSLVLRWQMALQ